MLDSFSSFYFLIFKLMSQLLSFVQISLWTHQLNMFDVFYLIHCIIHVDTHWSHLLPTGDFRLALKSFWHNPSNVLMFWYDKMFQNYLVPSCPRFVISQFSKEHWFLSEENNIWRQPSGHWTWASNCFKAFWVDRAGRH